jgi:hypothetical protein
MARWSTDMAWWGQGWGLNVGRRVVPLFYEGKCAHVVFFDCMACLVALKVPSQNHYVIWEGIR